MMTGRVKLWAGERGFGFIRRDDGEGDVYVRPSSVRLAGLDALHEGDRVAFDNEPGKPGKGPSESECDFRKVQRAAKVAGEMDL
jgi:CspA family cold shock protein